MMNNQQITEQFLAWAENGLAGLHDGPDNKSQEIACCRVYATIALAREVGRIADALEKRNGWIEADRERVDMLADMESGVTEDYLPAEIERQITAYQVERERLNDVGLKMREEHPGDL